MKRMAMAVILLSACAATVPSKFDQAHALYNEAAKTALAYAEQPDADETSRKVISEVIVRTGPVVIRASEILDDPKATESERELYARWATALLEEAVQQLTTAVLK